MTGTGMNFVIPSLLPALPEIFLLASICLILVVDLFVSDEHRIVTYVLALLSVLISAGVALAVLPDQPLTTFSGMFILDRLAVALKVATLLTLGVVFVYSRHYLSERDLHKGEFYLLSLFSVLGVMVIASARHFILLYLGLELMTLCLYALVAFNNELPQSSEAAMKYFVLGAMASGMMLYGMSILYGLTGSLYVTATADYIRQAGMNDPALLLSLVFILVALGFKLGIVPFHMWLPDVYEGANTPVTLLVGSISKIGAFGLFIRLLVAAMAGLYMNWQVVLEVLIVLSLALGAVVAIAQTNIKRMLAYSTINHMGFLLLGILAGTPEGYSAAMFYTLVYVLMTLGAFGVIILLSRKGFEADRLEDLKGLNERSPWYAAIMLLMMFSLAGVPPTVGFYAKFMVLYAIVQQDMLWLAVFAVMTAIVSAYYYLRVVKFIYFDAPQDQQPLQASMDMRVLLSLNGLAILGLGIMPGSLMALCAALF